jgi:hypothetical protein
MTLRPLLLRSEGHMTIIGGPTHIISIRQAMKHKAVYRLHALSLLTYSSIIGDRHAGFDQLV